MKSENITAYIFLVASAISVYVLNYYTVLDKLISGLIISLLTCYIAVLLFPKQKSIPAFLYSGVFIGMSGADRISLPMVLVASVIAIIVFEFLKNKFLGFGGKLGFISFI